MTLAACILSSSLVSVGEGVSVGVTTTESVVVAGLRVNAADSGVGTIVLFRRAPGWGRFVRSGGVTAAVAKAGA